jgi:hypothetical protein
LYENDFNLELKLCVNHLSSFIKSMKSESIL